MNTYVGFWRRLAAFGFDYLILLGYLAVITAAGLIANSLMPDVMASLFGSPVSGQISGFVLITLPISLYFALSETSSQQATWGKRRMGLQVIRTDGTRLSRGRSLLRTGVKFLSWELAHTVVWQASFSGDTFPPILTLLLILVWGLIGLNLVMLIVSKTHQTLYDRIADTAVIRAS